MNLSSLEQLLLFFTGFIIISFFVYTQKYKRGLKQTNKLLRHYLREYDENIIASRTNTKGILTHVSTAFCQISEFNESELIGNTHNLIRHPLMKYEVYADLWESVLTKGYWNGEILNQSKSGRSYWVNMKIFPDYSDADELLGFYAIGQDISAKKELEDLTRNLEKTIESKTADIQASNDELYSLKEDLAQQVAHEVKLNQEKTLHLIHQSRLAQMGEMISMIAHQWRQPLASISAISSTLQVDIQLDNYKEDFFNERLEAISSLTEHLSITINDFRNFFKENKDMYTEKSSKIVHDVLSIVTSMAEENGVNIIVEEKAQDVLIHTHVTELKQVLLNLMKNAEDILLENKVHEPKIWVNVDKKEFFCIFTIRDNGGGVPENIIEKIFDPYFSTKLEKDGTGLGLYMSKIIIEDHCGGSIVVENINDGASFTIKIPLEQKGT